MHEKEKDTETIVSRHLYQKIIYIYMCMYVCVLEVKAVAVQNILMKPATEKIKFA